jgi:hypothetical protein
MQKAPAGRRELGPHAPHMGARSRGLLSGVAVLGAPLRQTGEGARRIAPNDKKRKRAEIAASIGKPLAHA